MPQILFIQSVPPTTNTRDEQGTITRKMARKLKEAVRGRGAHVVDRDLATRPPCLVDAFWKDAASRVADERTDDQKSRLRESDELVDEVMLSDVIVVSCPEYGYGTPAPLTAWLDNLVRPGCTYTVNERNPEVVYGLLHNKKVVVLMSGEDDKAEETAEAIRRRFSKLGVRNFDLVKMRLAPQDDPDIRQRKWDQTQTHILSVARGIQSRWNQAA
jgi:FMN-dependent NADH-azoreductase